LWGRARRDPAAKPALPAGMLISLPASKIRGVVARDSQAPGLTLAAARSAHVILGLITPTPSRRTGGLGATNSAKRGAGANGAVRGPIPTGLSRSNRGRPERRPRPASRLQFPNLQPSPRRRQRPRTKSRASRRGGRSASSNGSFLESPDRPGCPFRAARAGWRSRTGRPSRQSEPDAYLAGVAGEILFPNRLLHPRREPAMGWFGVDGATTPMIKHDYRPAKNKPVTADRSRSGGKAGGRKA
jgi:hypothetical protein